ncbi:MAG: hypothetical protein LBQ01_04740 [Prevotellaceae bacterium]|nr:hypothetical protein [Prevotellaceae bacterium]
MIDIDKIDGFPKLIPDESIRFEAKDELRRAPETDFECSESEYRHILAEEELADRYTLRLKPDTGIVMPDKNSLKHRTSGHRMLWLSLVAAAAMLAFVLITVKNRTADLPATVTAPDPKPKTDINIAATPKPETVPDKTAENKANIPVKKSGVKAGKSAPRSVKVKTAEPDTPAETPENMNGAARPENIRMERITAAYAPVEMMNREKTVFVYQPDYQRTVAFKTVNGIASVAEKLAADIGEARQNITQLLDGFRMPNILSRLSLDRGIDREIDEWAKNNPDIPFTVFIDYSVENQMSEICDETGKLVKVIFIANRSLKYRNNKTYQASNN